MFLTLTVEQRAWLLILLATWAVLLFGGFVLARSANQAGILRATRLLSSFTLVTAAWSLTRFAAGPTAVTTAGTPLYAQWIAIGMTFGLIGDLFMARVLPAPSREIAGMLAFGLGHVAYLAAMLTVGASRGLVGTPRFTAAWVIWLLIATAGWCFVIARDAHVALTLRLAALPYALLLGSTAGVASGLAVQNPAFLPLALGATLFLFSDFLIAIDLFGAQSLKFPDDLIWFTYGPGQMLIVYTSILL